MGGKAGLWRKVAVTVLILVITMGVGGCMGNISGQKKRQNINDVALEYMEQKYGEKFDYGASYGNSMSGTHDLLVKCESFPDQYVLVEIENYRSSNKIFGDNYLAVKYQAECIDLFHSYATDIFGEATIFYEVSRLSLSPDLPVAATLEEYLADTRVPLVIMAEVRASDFSSEGQAQRFAELIAANGTLFYISLVIVDDNEYGTLSSKDLDKKMSLDQFVDCAKIINLDGNVQVKWLGKE